MPHHLGTECGQHYSHARRHGGLLSVLTFRADSYGEITEKVGKNVADQLLAKVAKLVMGTLRAEDSMGCTSEATFALFFHSAYYQQALVFARIMHDQLATAQANYL